VQVAGQAVTNGIRQAFLVRNLPIAGRGLTGDLHPSQVFRLSFSVTIHPQLSTVHRPPSTFVSLTIGRLPNPHAMVAE
jgi:hypothetical protein